MKQKISKLQKVYLAAFGILFLTGLVFYFTHVKVMAQTSGSSLPIPRTTATQISWISGPAVTLDWKTSDTGVYGFKISKQQTGMGVPRIITIFNPVETGSSLQTNGGTFIDEKVQKGKTYTYFITTFDRGGNESAPAQVNITIN